jgi:hypothetical protein
VATVFAAPVRFAGMFESEPEAAADGDAEELAAEAEALADEAAALAGAEDVDEAGGVEDVELDELHAASARQLAVAATARTPTGRMFIRHVPPENRLMLASRLEEGSRTRGTPILVCENRKADDEQGVQRRCPLAGTAIVGDCAAPPAAGRSDDVSEPAAGTSNP